MKKIIGLMLLFFTTHQLLMAQNIGIGTTTPAFKLDVNGRMRVKTGTLNNVSTSSGIWMEDYRDGTNRAFFGMQDSIRIGFFGAGTGGTGWGFNFNTVTGNVGIGITNALSALHVHSPDNTFNSYLRLTHQTSGTSFSDGAYMGLDGNNLLFKNSENGIILFSNNGGDRLIVSPTGNIGVGIGAATPQAKFQIDGGNSAGGFSGGYLQLGSLSGSNLALDNQQIQARSLSGPSQLFLQNNGGGTSIGSGTGILVLPASGEINKPYVTGNSNLLPLAYGRVAENGAIVGSTGNFTVQKAETGKYIITLTGETNVYLNRNNYMIQVTPYIGYNEQFGILLSKAYFAGATIINDNTIIIQMAEPNVPYTNGSCANQCGPFSLVSGNKFFDEVDVGFSILIYKY